MAATSQITRREPSNRKGGRTMGRNAKCVEVRTIDGSLLCVLNISDVETGEEGKPSISTRTKEGEVRKDAANGAQNNGSPMTEAQQRYLFRLLVEQGHEGEKAHKKLK